MCEAHILNIKEIYDEYYRKYPIKAEKILENNPFKKFIGNSSYYQLDFIKYYKILFDNLEYTVEYIYKNLENDIIPVVEIYTKIIDNDLAEWFIRHLIEEKEINKIGIFSCYYNEYKGEFNNIDQLYKFMKKYEIEQKEYYISLKTLFSIKSKEQKYKYLKINNKAIDILVKQENNDELIDKLDKDNLLNEKCTEEDICAYIYLSKYDVLYNKYKYAQVDTLKFLFFLYDSKINISEKALEKIILIFENAPTQNNNSENCILLLENLYNNYNLDLNSNHILRIVQWVCEDNFNSTYSKKMIKHYSLGNEKIKIKDNIKINFEKYLQHNISYGVALVIAQYYPTIDELAEEDKEFAYDIEKKFNIKEYKKNENNKEYEKIKKDVYNFTIEYLNDKYDFKKSNNEFKNSLYGENKPCFYDTYDEINELIKCLGMLDDMIYVIVETEKDNYDNKNLKKVKYIGENREAYKEVICYIYKLVENYRNSKYLYKYLSKIRELIKIIADIKLDKHFSEHFNVYFHLSLELDRMFVLFEEYIKNSEKLF